MGEILYYALQAGTMLILVLAANTSFADSPVWLVPGGGLVPAQAAHEAGAPVGVLQRDHLPGGRRHPRPAAHQRQGRGPDPALRGGGVPLLHPLPVGHAKHHLPGAGGGVARGLAINGFGAFLSATVCVIIAVTKFVDGAWIVLVILPWRWPAPAAQPPVHQEDTELEHEAEVPEAGSRRAGAPTSPRQPRRQSPNPSRTPARTCTLPLLDAMTFSFCFSRNVTRYPPAWRNRCSTE